MPMVNSGPISLGGDATSGGLNQSVNIELGRSATASINMNESAVRTLAGVPSGAISMNNFYGKSNRVSRSATISSDTSNYVLNTAKAPSYEAGRTDMTLTINSGVFVSSTSTGSYAFTVDTSWAAGDTVTVINNGTIIGRGGNGGSGNSGTGNAGGPALLVQRTISFNNANRISGGGGGGGAGSQEFIRQGKADNFYGGGGGGGGIGVSSGGSGGSGFNGNGQPGSGGTLTSVGTGGVGGTGASRNAGGTGGSFGASGSNGNAGGGPGGAGGAAVVGNSFITWIAFGTRNGSIS